MRKYVCIGLGGVLGAVFRYLAEGMEVTGYHGNFPLNTFLINLSGSLVITLVLTLAADGLRLDPDIHSGITTGFLGAYTTFSTYCRETADLMAAGAFLAAASYALLSVTLGLGAAYAGFKLARMLSPRLIKSNGYGENQAEAELE